MPISPSVQVLRNLGGVSPSVEEVKKLEFRSELPDVRLELSRPGEGKKVRPQQPEGVDQQIEHYRATYERSIESPREEIAETSLPWVVRVATRDLLYDGFIDPPVGLGDNWSLQLTYNEMTQRAIKLKRMTQSVDTRTAMGFGQEPWRKPNIIPEQNTQKLLEKLIVDSGGDKVAAKSQYEVLKRQAEARIQPLSNELIRSRDELTTVRRVIYLWWAWRNAASGQEVGQAYLESKIPTIPRFDDFQRVFALPSTFMTKNEVGNVPGYPRDEHVEALLQAENLTKEKEAGSFGELVQREARLMNLVALSDQPEEVMKWKLQAETKALHDVLETKGVDSVYLFLKRKGIEGNDPVEEAKIAKAISGLSDEEKSLVNNAFWKQFGYKNAEEARKTIGDPEKWIPLKARRGGEGVIGDSSPYLENDIDRDSEVKKIVAELEDLKKDWQKLSPLNNKSSVERAAIFSNIAKRTDALRALFTKGPDGRLVTIFATLQLENELGLRGKATEQGCVWARPQMAKDKVSIMDGALVEFVGGNKLAFEEAQAIVGIMGIPAKWGYYARDYDPGKPFTKQWKVDVEAWPYTSEMQNILAFPWHQLYKEEAGGPDASRGKFGPLMTDYLTAYPVEMYDKSNNKLFVVADKDGNLKYGRPDEGVIVADTAVTLMDYWHEGGNLANPEPWGKVIEDPYRRFMLRGFFALGRAALGTGDELLGLWKRRDWKFEDLESDKFWDGYKLARRVAFREELSGEDVWSDVVKTIDETYQNQAGKIVAEMKAASSEDARKEIQKKHAALYRKWREDRKQELFDYSDQTFWNGIMSTTAFSEMQFQQELKKLGEYQYRSPEAVIMGIIVRAKTHGINLLGQYSTSNKEMPDLMQKVIKIYNKINL